MLNITMHEGDYVVINGNVRVHFEKLKGGRNISLGIDAPRDVPILRGQAYEQMIAEQASPEEAQALREKMQQEFVERRLKTGSRKAKKRWGDKLDPAKKEVAS